MINSLTPIALILDGIGAIMLIAPEYKSVDVFAKKLDPVYRSSSHLRKIFDQNDWGKLVDMGQWWLIPARLFLNRQIINGNIGRNDTIKIENDIEAPLCFANGEKLRTISESGEETSISKFMVDSWIEKYHERRMYQWGLLLFVIGLCLQLISYFYYS